MAVPFTTALLAAELTNDPLSMGYAALKAAADDAGLAAKLNSLAAPGAATVWRNDIKASEFFNAIVAADFTALTQLQTSKLSLILATGILDATNANLRAIVLAMFSGATLTALNVVAQRTGSRAEFLWGTGFVVTPSQVGAGR